MKIQYQNKVPADLLDIFRDVAQQLDAVSEGRITASHNARTSAPTVGAWKRGDFVRNSEPSELGSVSSKYLIFGWSCVASGEPGTWKECRFLTGN